MEKRSFFVRACWDAEAGVFYSESDISGLHIEAESIEQFEALMLEFAPELVMTNHVSAPNFMSTPVKDWMPAIFWQRPENNLACA